MSAGKHRETVGPRVRLRIDVAPGCSIGPGKIDLLDAIERDGSLSLAARNLGMSYRRAWLLVDDLNRSFAVSIVTLIAGGANGGGARVTGEGRALIAQFRALERAVTLLARRRMRTFRARAVTRSAPAPRKITRLRRALRASR